MPPTKPSSRKAPLGKPTSRAKASTQKPRTTKARATQAASKPRRPANQLTPSETRAYRELFWQNVIREVLVSLVMLRAKAPQHQAQLAASSEHVASPAATSVLDGRFGLITKSGQRVAIAAVYPVFSASVGASKGPQGLSAVLQSTVFQVHTPAGEVYTLPLHEIRGFHALTEELMDQLEAAAREQSANGEQVEPFGFAAFTSMAQGRLPEDMLTDDNDESASGAD